MAKLEKLDEYEMNMKNFWEVGEKLANRAQLNFHTGVWSQSQIEQLNEFMKMLVSIAFSIDSVVKHNR